MVQHSTAADGTVTVVCLPGWTPQHFSQAVADLGAEVTHFDYRIAEDGTEIFILTEVA